MSIGSANHGGESGDSSAGSAMRGPSDVVLRIERALLDSGVPANKVRSVICKTCGISYQSVYHWFNGRTGTPRAEYLALLARRFDFDLVTVVLGSRAEKTGEGAKT